MDFRIQMATDAQIRHGQRIGCDVSKMTKLGASRAISERLARRAVEELEKANTLGYCPGRKVKSAREVYSEYGVVTITRMYKDDHAGAVRLRLKEKNGEFRLFDTDSEILWSLCD